MGDEDGVGRRVICVTPIFGPTVPCFPGQQESKPVGVKRSLSVDLNDLWIGTYVCCANWKIAPINPSKRKREISPPRHPEVPLRG